jgi:hypothetical protein
MTPSTRAALCVLSALCGGCVFGGGSGERPEGFRLVEGRLQVPDEDLLGRQVTGLQMAALHVNGEGGVVPFVSDVFDPAASRREAAFVVAVDGAVDFVLVLQVPSASARGIGDFLGQLRFDNGRSLLPKGEEDIDTGVLNVATGGRVPADTVLSGSSGDSPTAQVDSDGDGQKDSTDTDDDNDDVADGADTDVAGDGVDDATQVLEAFEDEDGDGVADVLAG